jgi:tRNA (Thr-GGU) A37 N-methylase
VRVLALRAGTPAEPGEPPGMELDVEPLEAIDGTPIIDLKPVWGGADP